MRRYECHPVGKPEKTKTVCVRNNDGYIRGLKPKTKYKIQRRESFQIETSDEEGKIRIGSGYSLGL